MATYHGNVTSMAQSGPGAAAAPIIRTIGLTELHRALQRGWEDFKAVPSHAIILCIIYPVLGLMLARAVLGYSVNESVVIFDRIRETFRRFRKLNTHEVIDHAITSTISRTIITHGSTQMMVLSMLVFGGQTLHYFPLEFAADTSLSNPLVLTLNPNTKSPANGLFLQQENLQGGQVPDRQLFTLPDPVGPTVS